VRDRSVTPREVAWRLHRNEQTIRRYLREGQLRGIRMGNQWLITDADLQRFLDERRRGEEQVRRVTESRRNQR
jgi:excisionase family DNA binding protein